MWVEITDSLPTFSSAAVDNNINATICEMFFFSLLLSEAMNYLKLEQNECNRRHFPGIHALIPICVHKQDTIIYFRIITWNGF